MMRPAQSTAFATKRSPQSPFFRNAAPPSSPPPSPARSTCEGSPRRRWRQHERLRGHRRLGHTQRHPGHGLERAADRSRTCWSLARTRGEKGPDRQTGVGGAGGGRAPRARAASAPCRGSRYGQPNRRSIQTQTVSGWRTACRPGAAGQSRKPIGSLDIEGEVEGSTLAHEVRTDVPRATASFVARAKKRDDNFYCGILADLDDFDNTFTMKPEAVEAFRQLGVVATGQP